jgi:hypothetical protein
LNSARKSEPDSRHVSGALARQACKAAGVSFGAALRGYKACSGRRGWFLVEGELRVWVAVLGTMLPILSRDLRDD